MAPSSLIYKEGAPPSSFQILQFLKQCLISLIALPTQPFISSFLVSLFSTALITILLAKSLLITTLCCLTTSSLASTWPSTIDGKPLPDKWFQISLNETSLDTRDVAEIAERTPITVCERTVVAVGACVGIATYVVGFARNIATTIKDLSNGGNCNAMHGTFEGLRWTYYSSGRNCDTTAQHDTIAGAIKKYLNNVEHNNICGTQCLRMDHGGTWDGWLKLGPVGSFNENAYCGPSLSFDSCLSGGNNDI
jgi:hypothetical protein